MGQTWPESTQRLRPDVSVTAESVALSRAAPAGGGAATATPRKLPGRHEE